MSGMRRALISGLVLVLAGAIGFALHAQFEARKARAHFAKELGEPDLARLAGSSLPTAENAATWIVRGIAAFDPEVPLRDEARRLAALSPTAWAPEDSTAAEQLLAGQATALGLLQQAASCPAGNFDIDYPRGASAPLPDYLTLLAATPVLVVDARLALVKGDVASVVLDLDTLAAILDALATESLLVSTLVAFAIDAQYLALVRDTLASGGADVAILDSVDRHLARHDPRRALRRGLRGEGSLVVAAERLAGMESSAGPVLGAAAAALRSPFERLAQADLLEAYRLLATELELPWPQLEARIARRAAERRDWDYSTQLMVNLEHAARRLKGLESSYGLARMAVGYARTGASEEPGLDPLTGDPVVSAPLPGGGRSFAAAGAAAIWNELAAPETQGATPPPFDWSVPRSEQAAAP